MNKEILIITIMLLICFQIKHFLSDYVWQTKYMLGKLNKTNWFLPLLSHSLVHAVFTFGISYAFTSNIRVGLFLFIFDLITHFIIDKAKVELSRPYSPQDGEFWQLLGLDQFFHHITHYLIILFILSDLGLTK